MYLKYLEIQGFKSFPDKTLVTFGHDITAIVGPNGSGKSNISDALRWVMGEQNSRSLRGQKMEDVIFGGTQKRAQVGYAEATLVLDNSDRALRYDADELMVTRRYYRSGESEFYINRKSVRLRDVNELFMDTGLGREGYSNISQGRIDEILALKSTDRREIFEEAAGISKYRHRKEETERRLATTEDNLLRIGDKISELELQVEPLREQAARAKQFLAYREELRGVEVALWLRTLEKLGETARKAEQDYASAAFILQQEHEALNALYVTSESLTFDLHNRDLQAEQLRQQIADAEARVQNAQGEIAVLQTNAANLRENLTRLRDELSEQEQRSGGIAGQIAALEMRRSEIAGQCATLRDSVSEAQREGERLTQNTEGLTKRYLELRGAQEQVRSTLSAKNADKNAVAESIAHSAEHIALVRADLDAAVARRAQTQSGLSEAQRRLAEAQEEITAAQNTIEGYRLRQTARVQKRDALQKQANDTAVRLDTNRSRLQMFEELQRDFEGYSKAVRVVMQQSARGTLRGIHGPVSMLLRTEARYTVAVETALGSAMQQLVVDDENAGKEAIRYLSRTDSGRATFLPLNVITGSTFDGRGVEECPGFVGIASELVSYEGTYRQIIQNLLGKTVVSTDLDAAVRIARQYHHRFRVVTLDGQVVNAGGSMTGGAVTKSAGILSRANEIERLRGEQKSLEAQLSQQKNELAEAQRLAQQVEFELTAEADRLRAAQDDALRLEGERRQYEALLGAIGAAIDSSNRELESYDSRTAEDRRREAALTEHISALERQIGETERELNVLSDGQSVAAEQSSRLTERLTALRLELAALEAEDTSAQESAAHLRALEAEMQGDRSQRLQRIADYEREANGLGDTIAQRAGQLEALRQAAGQEKQRLQDALTERRHIEERKTSAEKEAQNKNRDILNMERETARLEAKKTAAEAEERQIIDRLWESYELTRSTAAQAAAEIESVPAAQKRAAELKKKISALGSPNIGAIEEFARVNERYEYLTSQRDDVLTSKRELEGIISDITKQMTDIFTTEFSRINRYFGETFVEMFGGGKGSLELEDPSDPLSCGIEIRVQPPGKQLKTITLLSGGEKAFVAIALYFSILKVRPTPFCMLDEIDAALDDRNVERFAHYLHGLSEKTQFIVITHRRGTMEAAAVLYGVTMQEQGISKILHLDLNEMERQLGIEAV